MDSLKFSEKRADSGPSETVYGKLFQNGQIQPATGGDPAQNVT
jgi:hypothetical protein